MYETGKRLQFIILFSKFKTAFFQERWENGGLQKWRGDKGSPPIISLADIVIEEDIGNGKFEFTGYMDEENPLLNHNFSPSKLNGEISDNKISFTKEYEHKPESIVNWWVEYKLEKDENGAFLGKYETRSDDGLDNYGYAVCIITDLNNLPE